MGAGKTSIGRKLARALGTTFFDTDIAVVREHGTIAEIFAAHGEARFRELEREAVVQGLRHGGIVALGGGAADGAIETGDGNGATLPASTGGAVGGGAIEGRLRSSESSNAAGGAERAGATAATGTTTGAGATAAVLAAGLSA